MQTDNRGDAVFFYTSKKGRFLSGCLNIMPHQKTEMDVQVYSLTTIGNTAFFDLLTVWSDKHRSC